MSYLPFGCFLLEISGLIFVWQYIQCDTSVAMYLFSVLVSDGAGPINVHLAASCMTSGHNDGSNLPSSNNSEEPLPLELHPTTPVPLQVSVPCSMVYPQCTCMNECM